MPRAHRGAREQGGGGGRACKSKDGGEKLHDDGVVLGGWRLSGCGVYWIDGEDGYEDRKNEVKIYT
jgi:hypothetical protein